MSVFTVHLLVLTPFSCDSHQLLKGAQKPASAQLRVQRWTDGKKAWCVCVYVRTHAFWGRTLWRREIDLPGIHHVPSCHMSHLALW